jgi:hypothetical protein
VLGGQRLEAQGLPWILEGWVDDTFVIARSQVRPRHFTKTGLRLIYEFVRLGVGRQFKLPTLLVALAAQNFGLSKAGAHARRDGGSVGRRRRPSSPRV